VNAEEFIASQEQKVVENLWSARNAFTIDDREFLADLKVEYGDCCGLESNCPLEIRIERTCEACGEPADPQGWCAGMREFMQCKPHFLSGNPCVYGCGEISCHYTLYVCDNQRKTGRCGSATRAEADRAFLNSCGIAVEDTPRVSRGTVYAEIVMQGEVVRKARELHARRKRKPLMGERRASGCGEINLGDLS
jgi:hypothetical protein